MPVQSEEIITSISAGFNHYAFTTSKGNLFTFGQGAAQGQLCHGDTLQIVIQIKQFSKSVQLFTQTHSLFFLSLNSPKLVTKFGKELFFEKAVCGGSFTITCVRKRVENETFYPEMASEFRREEILPTTVTEKKPGFFERLFGGKRKAENPPTQPDLGPDGQPVAKKSRSCTIL